MCTHAEMVHIYTSILKEETKQMAYSKGSALGNTRGLLAALDSSCNWSTQQIAEYLGISVSEANRLRLLSKDTPSSIDSDSMRSFEEFISLEQYRKLHENGERDGYATGYKKGLLVIEVDRLHTSKNLPPEQIAAQMNMPASAVEEILGKIIRSNIKSKENWHIEDLKNRIKDAIRERLYSESELNSYISGRIDGAIIALSVDASWTVEKIAEYVNKSEEYIRDALKDTDTIRCYDNNNYFTLQENYYKETEIFLKSLGIAEEDITNRADAIASGRITGRVDGRFSGRIEILYTVLNRTVDQIATYLRAENKDVEQELRNLKHI